MATILYIIFLLFYTIRIVEIRIKNTKNTQCSNKKVLV